MPLTFSLPPPESTHNPIVSFSPVFETHSPSSSSPSLDPVHFNYLHLFDGKSSAHSSVQSSGSSASSEAICVDFSHLLNGKSPDKRNEEDVSASSANNNANDTDETMSCQSNIYVFHDVNIPEPNTAASTDVESATALAKALLNNTESLQISAEEEELIANSVCKTKQYTLSKGYLVDRFFDAIQQYGSCSLKNLYSIVTSSDRLFKECYFF